MSLLQEVLLNLNLSGTWAFQLDEEDEGLREQWFNQTLTAASCCLPGTTNENKIGVKLQEEWALDKEAVRALRPHYRYIGAAWYQRRIEIPAGWEHKAVQLFLERVMHHSQVWLDDQPVGAQDSLSAPHIYDLTAYVKPGAQQVLTIRVDNRDIHKLGSYPSAYTDETQTIWNGMLGRLELRALDPIHCGAVQVMPNDDLRTLRVLVKIVNKRGTSQAAVVKIRSFLSEQAAASGDDAPASAADLERIVQLTGSCEESFEFHYDLGESAQCWDEFHPVLYTLEVAIAADTQEGKITNYHSCQFGMRTFRANGSQLEINGRKTFLRGTLECCIFPLTGYPPMELSTWEKLFNTVKAYGLNHIRFHSWCPPEAAFTAADRAGIYLQIEGPVWMDTWNTPVGSDQAHYDFLPLEAERIVAHYGNHPSFCIFSNGNELNGDFDLLQSIIARLKAQDNRRVYTLTANWDRPLNVADDLFIAQTVDGVGVRGQYFPEALVNSTQLDFREAVALREVPVISHEVGQYSVYPDVDQLDKYNGLLKAVNLEVIRQDLVDKGLSSDVRKFVEGSGKLAVLLYRDEIEAALRTPGMGGFQLLDLHDFPGQSTATVGILDAFWDSKGLISPEEFRRFCGPTVLLLRMDKRMYRAEESFRAEAEIAHFGSEELPGCSLRWQLVYPEGEVYAEGGWEISRIPIGNGYSLGTFETALGRVQEAQLLRVVLWLEGTAITNSWDIWVYPQPTIADEKLYCETNGLAIASSFGEREKQLLEDGGRLLLLPEKGALARAQPGKFFPVFWSPVHFASPNPCGIYADASHPVFRRFPTYAHASYPWQQLLDGSESLEIDGEVPLIVQVIPNFYSNKRLANLLEFQVGGGKVLLCTLNLEEQLDNRIAARQLRESILMYMASDDFSPSSEIGVHELENLLALTDANTAVPVLTGTEFAIGKRARADSEHSPECAAARGNDGIGHTYWCAADEQKGHWWQVDLGEAKPITGIRVKFLQAANYLYVIQLSDDGDNWRLAVNQTGQTATDQVRVVRFSEHEQARFVRIVYNGLPQGVVAGHYQFEVYGI